MHKILLINAVNPSVEVEIRYPPLGLGYLAGSLRNRFGCDLFHFKICDRDIERELCSFHPDIVGISSVSQNYNIAKKYAAAARSMGIPVVIGGIHISMLPGSLTGDMDLGVLGEGEETMAELMELFLETGQFPEKRLSGIKGIVYRTEGRLQLTAARPAVTPLDEIPLPARDLLKIERHSYIFSSRGCPYRCTFCASSRYWDKLRFFSPEYVVGEIRELVNRYDVRFISFFDDLMMADRKRLAKIVSSLQMPGRTC
ncbi:MAG: cobalamin B12-binding domain-containing protein [Armatimonadetes bacterium]|nr:cobalamin B12-binding domain-containing protein [Armatimonadota bacterium]